MRVTQNQMTSQYLRNSGSSLSNMNKINERVMSQRQYMKASEDPLKAAKAMEIRGSINDTDIYLANLQTAEGVLDAAEESILTISDQIINSVTDKIIYAVNDPTQNAEILSNELKTLADQMVAQMNTTFSDRTLFGGTNNDEAPFKYDEELGVLTFNGVDVTEADLSAFPETASIPMDIGLGIKYDENGVPDPQTVLDISMNGVEITGFGVDDEGYPLNVIALTYEAAEACATGDIDATREYLDRIHDAKSALVVHITEIGNKQQTVTMTTTKVKNDLLNLQEAQVYAEGYDTIGITEQLTLFKTAEMAYNATLSMGSKVVPMSIFDYIN